jgi:hypothetical protein
VALSNESGPETVLAVHRQVSFTRCEDIATSCTEFTVYCSGNVAAKQEILCDVTISVCQDLAHGHSNRFFFLYSQACY